MKKILIVGRPNVGKSSLFNRLIKKRKSLVMNTPGITRDILKGEALWWGTSFEVWDSGGFNSTISKSTASSLHKEINQTLKKSFKDTDLILFIMDAKIGLQEEDKIIYKLIRNKTHLLVVNKVDQKKKQISALSEFYSLEDSFIEASFEKDENIDQIVHWIIQHTDKDSSEEVPTDFSMMITGQPNVGKSSLFNQILKKNRSIVSSTPNTTIDVVDDFFQFETKRYEVLDSAGIGRRSKQTSDKQRLASAKTISYYKKTDLILLLIDTSKMSNVSKISRQDIRLLSYCLDEKKPVIIIFNKWDLRKTLSKIFLRKLIKDSIPFYHDVSVLFTNALSSLGVSSIVKKVNELRKQSQTQITTSKLNQFLRKVTEQAPPPIYGTKNIKFYYLTQTDIQPPQFLIFTNEPKGVSSSYKKFLSKRIQKEWNIKNVPIQLNFRKRK